MVLYEASSRHGSAQCGLQEDRQRHELRGGRYPNHLKPRVMEFDCAQARTSEFRNGDFSTKQFANAKGKLFDRSYRGVVGSGRCKWDSFV